MAKRDRRLVFSPTVVNAGSTRAKSTDSMVWGARTGDLFMDDGIWLWGSLDGKEVVVAVIFDEKVDGRWVAYG